MSRSTQIKTNRGTYTAFYFDEEGQAQVNFETASQNFPAVGRVEPEKQNDESHTFNASCRMPILLGTLNKQEETAAGFSSLEDAVNWIMETTEKYIHYEVRYTVQYSDGRLGKSGKFITPTNNPRSDIVFSKLVGLEPNILTSNVNYITVKIWPVSKIYDQTPPTREEIGNFAEFNLDKENVKPFLKALGFIR